MATTIRNIAVSITANTRRFEAGVKAQVVLD